LTGPTFLFPALVLHASQSRERFPSETVPKHADDVTISLVFADRPRPRSTQNRTRSRSMWTPLHLTFYLSEDERVRPWRAPRASHGIVSLPSSFTYLPRRRSSARDPVPRRGQNKAFDRHFDAYIGDEVPEGDIEEMRTWVCP
jgi:hypothetical protein